LAVGALGQTEWDAQSYPNPTTNGYQQCNMKNPSSICDPDSVLTEQQRYRLNYELTQLESRTRQLNGHDFCEKKGITGAIAIAKHVRGGSENAVKMMANEMLRSWKLDNQCQKSVVIAVSTDDRKVWIGRDSRVPVYAQELTEIAGAQRDAFRSNDYQQALNNILQAIWDKALSKQAPGTDDGSSRGVPFSPADDRRRGGYPEKGGKSFSIPGWFWLLLVLVIVPLVCCCCCIYFCCCRGTGGSARAQADPERGGGGGGMPMGGGGGGRGGGGGNPLSGFLGGMGGAAIGNQISSWLSGRGRRGDGGGAAPPPPYDPGYQPGVPHEPAKGGRGLYPSAPVKDEGGGTSW